MKSLISFVVFYFLVLFGSAVFAQQPEKKVVITGVDIKNIPIGRLHLSIAKDNSNDEALKFPQWVVRNSQESLIHFGVLKAEPKRFQHEKAKFDVAIN